MLPSRLVRINSRYATGRFSNSNFTFCINSALVDNVQMVTLVSASIPRLFTNIFTPINVLNYTISEKEYSIVVPEGQYTADELAKQIDLDPSLGCSYDDITHRFIFSHTVVVGKQILQSSSPIAHYIGLCDDIELRPLSYTAASAPPVLGGPDQVYVQSQFLAQTNCCTSLEQSDATTNIPLICAVDCSAVPYGWTIHYDARTDLSSMGYNELAVGSRISMRRVDVQICDVFGNILNLPRSAFVDLVFKIHYTVGF